MLSFILVSSILLGDVNKAWLKYFAVLSVMVYSFLWFEYVYSFNQENKNFTPEFFAGIPREGKLAGLIYDNTYRGRKVYIHFPNYFIVWKKGIAASKIIDYRFGVVRRVAPETELPFYHELIGENYSYQEQYSNIDYLLVRGTAPVNDDLNLRNFRLWKESEPWKIYQRGR